LICTTVNENLEFEIFSRAKYIVLVDDKNDEVVLKVENPALSSPMKRPLVAKECVKLKADTVIAPHGSLCFPSYRILKKANIKMLISKPDNKLTTKNLKEVNMREVMYSSFLAIYERIRE